MSIALVEGYNIMPLFFAILFGLGYGATVLIIPSVSADIIMDNSFGLIFAVICIGAGVRGSLGAYVFGLLRDISGGCLILSCLFVWFAAPGKVRRTRQT